MGMGMDCSVYSIVIVYESDKMEALEFIERQFTITDGDFRYDSESAPLKP
jgi:hypothetical protein